MFRTPSLFPSDITLSSGGTPIVSEVMDQSLLSHDDFGIGIMSVQWTRGGSGVCVLTVEASNHPMLADKSHAATGVVWTTTETVPMTDVSGGKAFSRPPYRFVRLRLTPAVDAGSTDVNVWPCWP